eukprot:2658379-Amphidinium_carterae.2
MISCSDAFCNDRCLKMRCFAVFSGLSPKVPCFPVFLTDEVPQEWPSEASKACFLFFTRVLAVPGLLETGPKMPEIHFFQVHGLRYAGAPGISPKNL